MGSARFWTVKAPVQRLWTTVFPVILSHQKGSLLEGGGLIGEGGLFNFSSQSKKKKHMNICVKDTVNKKQLFTVEMMNKSKVFW